MNQLLLKNRPKDLDEAKFKQMWENSSYLLEALYKTIQELTPQERISQDDLSNPAFIHKMVWGQAQRDLAKKIVDLLPQSLTTK